MCVLLFGMADFQVSDNSEGNCSLGIQTENNISVRIGDGPLIRTDNSESDEPG